jgi:hypothetical protein
VKFAFAGIDFLGGVFEAAQSRPCSADSASMSDTRRRESCIGTRWRRARATTA